MPWGNDIVRFYGPVTANNFFVNSCESGIYNTLTLNNGGNAVIQNGGELGLENADTTFNGGGYYLLPGRLGGEARRTRR